MPAAASVVPVLLADGVQLEIDRHAPALSYADRSLGDEGVSRLCAALASHISLQSLDLRGCKDDEKEVLSLVPGELRARTGLKILKKKSVVNRNFEQSDKWRLSDYTA